MNNATRSDVSGDEHSETRSGHSLALGDRLEGWANWLDRRPALILLPLAGVYVVLLQWWLRLILWYDELHTFYIAQAPTLPAMMDEIRNVDLNPPLIYVLVRASHAIFGVTAVATRLPSVVAFFLASAAVLVFLSRRVGGLWAAAAIALFWSSPFFRYATEARPYGILLAFFALTLLSWDSAASQTRPGTTPAASPRRWALAGIAAGNTGMMLSHVLAPFSILPFCFAELVRSLRTRRIDWAVWAALLLPLASEVLVRPLMQHVGAATYPPVFQASWGKAAVFYKSAFLSVLPNLLGTLVLGFLVAAWRRGPSTDWHPLDTREAPFFAVALLPPLLLNALMMRSGGPFWDRYCITSALVFYMVIMLFVAHECRLNRLAGFAALVVLATFALSRDVKLLRLQEASSAEHHITIDRVRPDLPFVVNAATTFLAIDHQEDPAFLDRVYYLVDRESALRYAHTDIFEGIAELKQYFPIRAHIESYADFAANHPHFLVFGEADQQDQWLLRKLIAEGAQVAELGDYNTPYEDSQLHEVTLQAEGEPARR